MLHNTCSKISFFKEFYHFCMIIFINICTYILFGCFLNSVHAWSQLIFFTKTEKFAGGPEWCFDDLFKGVLCKLYKNINKIPSEFNWNKLTYPFNLNKLHKIHGSLNRPCFDIWLFFFYEISVNGIFIGEIWKCCSLNKHILTLHSSIAIS